MLKKHQYYLLNKLAAYVLLDIFHDSVTANSTPSTGTHMNEPFANSLMIDFHDRFSWQMLMAEAHEWFSWQIHHDKLLCQFLWQKFTAGYLDVRFHWQILLTTHERVSWQIFWQIKNPHDKIVELPNAVIVSCQNRKSF